MAVSRGTQQRLVQRQTFEVPIAQEEVEEVSIDGGKVRIRTPKGESCRWQDYKAVASHGHSCEAFFQENEQLIEDYGYFQAERISIGSGTMTRKTGMHPALRSPLRLL